MSLLEEMRSNPRDWQIGDVGRLCNRHGVQFRTPSKGSHYKVSHPSRPEILTIPYARPIKAVYIKKLVQFIDAVRNNEQA